MFKNLPQRCLCEATNAALGGLVWSAEWLRSAEPDAAASLGKDLSYLMNVAGTAAYASCVAHYGNTTKHWVVLVGPGNNGGDGYVVARLAKKDGRRVTVLAMPHSKPLPPEAEGALKRWMDDGGSVSTISQDTAVPEDADLLIDGLLGTGISGAPRDVYADLISRANSFPAKRFAIDIPSGLNAETGAAPGVCFRADHTTTFISLKPGLLTGEARKYVGQLTYSTLGLDQWLADPGHLPTAQCRRLTAADLNNYCGTPRAPTEHKGVNGRVLLIGGARGFGGAILMAAEASLSSGAGFTRVLTDKEHVAPLLARSPEAMYVAVDSTQALDTAALEAAMDWADVLAVGPGLGTGLFGETALQASVRHAAAHPEKTLVLDADALNLLPRCVPDGTTIPRSVITPHPGEAARLLGCSIAEVESDRYEAARKLASRLGGVCVLKGPGTIVCLHTNESCERPHIFSCAVVDAGNPGMATGGMGDVLTGVLASLSAQKMSGNNIFEVACAGTLVHSVAADLAVVERGTRGLRATDLIPHLRECVNAPGISHV